MTRSYRAPGRVNLIGEHTDYNDGFVMPIAIDRATTAAMTPRADRRIRAQSGRGPVIEVDLDAPGAGPTGSWGDYVRGVAAVLERQGHKLTGADIEIQSTVPAGAGLSSSAALEVSVGFGLLDLAGVALDPTSLALACQQAEQEFAGTRCGVMDQFVACHGRPGHALMLDTRSLAAEFVPLPPDVRVVVCNSMTKHAHVSGEYNARRADCEAGVLVLSTGRPEVRALRDVTLADLDILRDELGPRVYRRCRHVITENARVRGAAQALRQADVAGFGRLMVASHHSMRDDYEITTREIDALVEFALACEGVHGARMTGGGFGGCVIALVDAPAVANMAATVRDRYLELTGRAADVYPCTASGGVRRVA
jgi:galactokinase